MRIRISGRADVLARDGTPLSDPELIPLLDGARSDEALADHLDMDLADLGITGGSLELRYDPDSHEFQARTEYLAPEPLDPETLQRLAADTWGQWSDGAGTHAFTDLRNRLNVSINLTPGLDEQSLLIELIDDGTPVEKPRNALARAARDGDLAALRALLDVGEGTENCLQGYTPLHLAILYGQPQTAEELIARGADILARDPLQGDDPLMLSALADSLSDADSARIARLLLERGAPPLGPHGPEANPEQGQTPLSMAEIRHKSQLAAVLREFGAAL